MTIKQSSKMVNCRGININSSTSIGKTSLSKFVTENILKGMNTHGSKKAPVFMK